MVEILFSKLARNFSHYYWQNCSNSTRLDQFYFILFFTVLDLDPDSGCLYCVVDLMALGDEIEAQLFLDLWWLYLGKLLVVPNFFHLILTENTMALGNFNFSCILPTFVPIHNLVSGLQSYLCIGFVSHIRCQTIYRYVNVFF